MRRSRRRAEETIAGDYIRWLFASMGLDPYREVSTKAGRRYARPATGFGVIFAGIITGDETIIAASQQRRAMVCKADEINFLGGPGKGVLLIKLEKSDQLLAAIMAHRRTRYANSKNEHRRRAAVEHGSLQSRRPRRQGT